MSKPILALDFDGVIHSYASGWKGATNIPDPPVAGAMRFISHAIDHFEVHIFSSRSMMPGGIDAMKKYLERELNAFWRDRRGLGGRIFSELKFPTEKPPARVSLDDRAMTFTGEWPDFETLKNFKPWYHQ